MVYRDPRCVFVSNNVGEAQVVATWLQAQGIDAEAMNLSTLGGFEGLTILSPGGTGTAGIEVWVHNPDQAPEAIALLTEHQERLAAEAAHAPQGPAFIDVVCEECGKRTTFPGKDRGSVETCPHCSAYLDVLPADEALESGEWEEQSEEISED